MNAYTTIQICDDSNVRTIKLNRPEKRNALNPTMIEELTTALDHAADGPCGAIILTGAGKCFCAGLDLDELQKMESRTHEEHQEDAERFARLIRLLYDFPKPTIAAVNGSAIAGGTGLATVCDFTYASQDASFGYTEVKIGFVPAIVSSFLLRQVGEKQARDLLLSGRIFDAKEAHHLGLVTRIIVHPQILLREAFNLGLCLLKNSPESMRWTKGLLSEHVREALDSELANAALWNARAKENDDLPRRYPRLPRETASGMAFAAEENFAFPACVIWEIDWPGVPHSSPGPRHLLFRGREGESPTWRQGSEEKDRRVFLEDGGQPRQQRAVGRSWLDERSPGRRAKSARIRVARAPSRRKSWYERRRSGCFPATLPALPPRYRVP